MIRVVPISRCDVVYSALFGLCVHFPFETCAGRLRETPPESTIRIVFKRTASLHSRRTSDMPPSARSQSLSLLSNQGVEPAHIHHFSRRAVRFCPVKGKFPFPPDHSRNAFSEFEDRHITSGSDVQKHLARIIL